jgi:hypothetical protein
MAIINGFPNLTPLSLDGKNFMENPKIIAG